MRAVHHDLIAEQTNLGVALDIDGFVFAQFGFGGDEQGVVVANYTAAGGHARVAPGMALRQVGANPRGLSRLAALGLKIHDRMAGMFLAFAGVGKKAINTVTTCGGQLVFNAPDFPQNETAFGPFNSVVLQCFHKSLMNSSGVASDGSV